MGRSIASGGDPKGSGRERREAGIQWIQPPKAVSDPEFRQTTSGTHGSANRADCLPRGKPPTRPLAHTPVLCGYADSPKGVQGGERKATLLAPQRETTAMENSPCWGLTRRLRRGLGLAVPWDAHTFLSVAKEKCAKESQRHGDSRGGPPRFALRPSPALRLCLATRFMASGHFWR